MPDSDMYHLPQRYATKGPGDLWSLPTYGRQLTLVPAQIRTLNSSPINILPAIRNWTIIPFLTQWYRAPGTGYTQGAATNIQLRINSGVVTQYGAGILTGVGPVSVFGVSPSTTSTGSGSIVNYTGTADGTDQTTGFPLQIFMAGGDVSGGSGDLTVTVFYWALPHLIGA